MRPSQTQIDRFLGVLVIVCASAVIVALGARAGSSLSTVFRVRFNDGDPSSDDETCKRRRKRKLTRGRSTRPDCTSATVPGARASREGSDSDLTEDEEAEEEVGDAYHVYAHGSRSVGGGSEEGRSRRRAEREEQACGRTVLHAGSCHCGGLVFEVDAPEHLVAIEGPSKVRYPFITVPAENFRLTSDDSNGSLYLLKCRPPSGRDTTPKVSAHFFCRRCGVHVVHAPDFPHAAVANVNVHCIHPYTVKSLAVGFMRGGGAEVPGMGDPVEGVYEVNREAWSDAMRERVHAALQQHTTTSATMGGGNVSSSRALSPRRRPSGDSSSRGASSREGESSSGRSLSDGGVSMADGGAEAALSGDVATWGAGGVMEALDIGTLRRNAEERERARQRMGFSRRPTGGTAAGRRGGNGRYDVGVGSTRSTGSTWGDVLMHVVSLPSVSSSSSSSTTASVVKSALRSHHYHHHSNGVIVNGTRGDDHSWTDSSSSRRGERAGLGGDAGLRRGSLRRATPEILLEGREKRWVGTGASGIALPPPAAARASRVAVGDINSNRDMYWSAVSAESARHAMGHSGRRSLSVDSGPAAQVVSSPGAQGVAFQDGKDASGGGRSSAREKGDSNNGGGGSAGRPAPIGSSTENGERSGLESCVESGVKNAARNMTRLKDAALAQEVAGRKGSGGGVIGFTSLSAGSDEEEDRYTSSTEDLSAYEKDERLLFARPPTAEGGSGGYAASQA